MSVVMFRCELLYRCTPRKLHFQGQERDSPHGQKTADMLFSEAILHILLEGRVGVLVLLFFILITRIIRSIEIETHTRNSS